MFGGGVMTLTGWAIQAMKDSDKQSLPAPAWYPIDMSSKFGYAIGFIYNYVGLYYSLSSNCSYDAFVSGTLAHINSQLLRLGEQVSQIGYENFNQNKIHHNYIPNELSEIVDKQKLKNRKSSINEKQINYYENSDLIPEKIENETKLHGKIYGQILKCIIFHQILIE